MFVGVYCYVCFPISTIFFTGKPFKSHDVMSLESMKRQIKAEFEGKLKITAEKITEICKREKDVWLELDSCEGEWYILIDIPCRP